MRDHVYWWERAACRGEWELFDSVDYDDHELAKMFCRQCPVFLQCHEEMMRVVDTPGISLVGTWAGNLWSSREGKQNLNKHVLRRTDHYVNRRRSKK